MSLLLRAGADVAAQASNGDTARYWARRNVKPDVVEIIDAHLRRQLRQCLVDVCVSLHAVDVPVLALLECFAWASSTTYASDHVELPLLLQWKIAKLVRDRGLN